MKTAGSNENVAEKSIYESLMQPEKRDGPFSYDANFYESKEVWSVSWHFSRKITSTFIFLFKFSVPFCENI